MTGSDFGEMHIRIQIHFLDIGNRFRFQSIVEVLGDRICIQATVRTPGIRSGQPTTTHDLANAINQCRRVAAFADFLTDFSGLAGFE